MYICIDGTGVPVVKKETANRKGKFVLTLDNDYEKVFKGFEHQVRRRIRKGYKSGCEIDISKKYFDDFYDIYRTNMQLLGSPSHKRSFYTEILNRFSDNYTILAVLHKNKVIGTQLLSYFKNTVYLPLASSLKEYNEYSPNQLLYWESIKFGCVNGYEFCDFGRSTIGSGPYVFKKQWNALEIPITYCYLYSKNGMSKKNSNSYDMLNFVSELWKRTPIQITNFIGPYLSKWLP
jgi:lipid II:glycine glycyltransferase (peptidoglycan interpeptide bridge formation enzyme)